MIDDLDRGVIERFLATPARRASLVVSQIVRHAVQSAICRALILLLVGAGARRRVGEGALGWVVIVLGGARSSPPASAGSRHGIALLTREGGDDDRGRQLHRAAAAVPLERS